MGKGLGKKPPETEKLRLLLLEKLSLGEERLNIWWAATKFRPNRTHSRADPASYKQHPKQNGLLQHRGQSGNGTVVNSGYTLGHAWDLFQIYQCPGPTSNQLKQNSWGWAWARGATESSPGVSNVKLHLTMSKVNKYQDGHLSVCGRGQREFLLRSLY